MTAARALVFITLAGGVAATAGCEHDLTQVVLVVQSDLTIPGDVDGMDVASIAGPSQPIASSFFMGTPLTGSFPFSVGFESGGATTAFSITVRLFKGVFAGVTPQIVLSRTVTDIRFVPEQTMMLVLPLTRTCACQGTSCPNLPECARINQPELQPFDPAVAPPSSTMNTMGVGGGTSPPPR